MTVGQAQARNLEGKARTRATRAKDLEVPRVYLGLRTLSTVGNVDNLPIKHETTEAALLLVKMTAPGTSDSGRSCNLNMKLSARLAVCGCVLSVVTRTHETLT